jgi:hypothetical protein
MRDQSVRGPEQIGADLRIIQLFGRERYPPHSR